ncbi:MAG: hypothetical protein WC657_07300 [Candidatus Paceibacterota bacterium]|jgi:hypothetical protein
MTKLLQGFTILLSLAVLVWVTTVVTLPPSKTIVSEEAERIGKAKGPKKDEKSSKRSCPEWVKGTCESLQKFPEKWRKEKKS